MTRKSNAPSLLERLLPTLVIVAFIVGWELFVRWRGIAPIFLPPPSSISGISTEEAHSIACGGAG